MKKLNLKKMVAYLFIVFLVMSLSADEITKPNTFSSGDVISAEKMNENFDTVYDKVNTLDSQVSAGAAGFGVVPVGAIIAWHKSFFNTPALPDGWVECNGQTLDDPDSPYDGQVIPNLNGAPVGADSPGLARKEKMFLRGGTTSGEGQDQQLEDHTHYSYSNPNGISSSYSSGTQQWFVDTWNYSGATPSDRQSTSVPITGSHGTETRPANMSVAWIIRVK